MIDIQRTGFFQWSWSVIYADGNSMHGIATTFKRALNQISNSLATVTPTLPRNVVVMDGEQLVEGAA